MTDAKFFELTDSLPSREWLLLEASAGTGKTYSLTALVVRYVAELGLRAEELLMVTFTRAAAAEMKQEVRDQLLRAVSALTAPDSANLEPWLMHLRDCDEAELNLRLERLHAAISSIDSASISTIHGFFQQVLGDLGIRSGEAKSTSPAESDAVVANKVVRDVMVRNFATNAYAFDPSQSKDPEWVEASVLKSLKAASSNLSAELAPKVTSPRYGGQWAEVIQRFMIKLTGVEFEQAAQWTDLIESLRTEIKAERVAQGVVAFDDLIIDLVEKLDDPVLGDEIVRILRSRFRLVLIDEFQDTDTFQWKLFSKVFDLAGVSNDFLAMIVVGDPKQAIYRFRGADVGAYLDAAKSMADSKRQMATNFRTDRPLVDSLNTWFAGAKFGDRDIGYVPVSTPEKHRDSRLTGGGKPLEIRFLPNSDNKVGPVRDAISIDVADHIQDLLEHGHIEPLPGSEEKRQKVTLGDICILVRDHDDADPLIAELRRRHIPVVRSRIGSVLDTDALEQLRVLFTALANPGDPRRLRALQLTWFSKSPFGGGVDGVVVENEGRDRIEKLQAACRKWAAELETRGIIGWYQVLRLDPEVIDQISTSFEAERRFTDLEHILELLDAYLGGRRVPVSAVLRALGELKQTMNQDADAQKRRIDTDRDAIQITTMHSSKGLEYPIVLMPFPKGLRATKSAPAVFRLNGMRYVDCAPSVPWILNGVDLATRREIERHEDIADQLRLFYVAVTRARHQLVIWWGQGKSKSSTPLTGALARFLFGDIENLEEDPKPKDVDEERRKIVELVERLGSNAGFKELTKWHDNREWEPPTPKVSGELHAQPFPDHEIERDGWYRWSYSSLSKGARSNNEGTARGGTDEAPGGPEIGGDSGPTTFNGPLLGMQASADFGTFVHELFEVIDLSAPDVDAEVRNVIERSGKAAAFDANPEKLAEGLVLAIDTPLNAAFDSPTLRSIGSQRLNELVFHFPLADGTSPVTPSDLFELAASHDAGEFSDYFKALAAGNRMPAMAGLMTGSIDSVIRLGDTADSTYGVVDYKTNRLHSPGESAPLSAYGHESMKQAMEHGDYPLQILVYNVALHRMLQLRLANYDIEKHIGDTHYLFVRGMIGPSTAVVDGHRNGVYAWRPSNELIVAASRLLGGQS